jgi:chitinase
LSAFISTWFFRSFSRPSPAGSWEYPNASGIGCNTKDGADLANFLAFLQELRADSAGRKLIVTAAGSLMPWKDATGTAAKDLSAFAKVIDRITLMNYDVWGPWANTAGPNAPLKSSCDVRSIEGSAEVGLAAWTAAGVPAAQLALGVAAYGHAFAVANANATGANGKLNMFPAFDASQHPLGDRFDDAHPGPDVCGATQNPSGVFTFRGLVEDGFLGKDGKPAHGIASGFDDCSETPAVYNASRGVWVSFDDARAFAAKGKFIKDNGLTGFAMWSAEGDYNDILVNSIRGAAGF